MIAKSIEQVLSNEFTFSKKRKRFEFIIATDQLFPYLKERMPYTLPNLPYPYNALEPHFDAQTMEIHHTKHHAAYVTNLNKALEGIEVDQNACVYALLKKINELPESIQTAVRNNGGGHANHSFFWPLLTPNGSSPTEEVLAAINENFESLEKFKEKFAAAGASRFGSGWAWLLLQPDGKLTIASTANQDHPSMPMVEPKGWPILALDVWEHAYYLRYQNRRADYIQAFWNVLNWNQVQEYYTAGKNFFANKGHC